MSDDQIPGELDVRSVSEIVKGFDDMIERLEATLTALKGKAKPSSVGTLAIVERDLMTLRADRDKWAEILALMQGKENEKEVTDG